MPCVPLDYQICDETFLRETLSLPKDDEPQEWLFLYLQNHLKLDWYWKERNNASNKVSNAGKWYNVWPIRDIQWSLLRQLNDGPYSSAREAAEDFITIIWQTLSFKKDNYSLKIRPKLDNQLTKWLQREIKTPVFLIDDEINHFTARALPEMRYEVERYSANLLCMFEIEYRYAKARSPATTGAETDKSEAIEKEVYINTKPEGKEWSRPTTKKNLIEKIGFDSEDKFNDWAERMGIRGVKGKRTWELCLDKLSPKQKEKLEKC
jgi:hypothetical protein